ncbi:MAG: histidine phosphatase family protein [Ilumatobacteraceae bacterium]
MSRVLLVRHGESNVTVQRIIGGLRSCTGLSTLGRQQAERLRDRWAADGFVPDAVVSSTYPRAVETAAIVSAAFGGLGVEQRVEFGEHDPGPDCDGMSYDDFAAQFGIGGWRTDDPYATVYPGGETVAAFQYRVGLALRALLDDHPERSVVVFCHGGVIDALLRHVLRAPSRGAFEVFTLNTSITEFERVSREGASPIWRLVRYNDAAHLSGLPAATAPLA